MAVSGQTSRKVVGTATAAISSGTIAIHEPKTTASTISAPAPASRTSRSTLTLVSPPSPDAEAARRASRPVTSTGEPPTVTPSSARWAWPASCWPGSSPGTSGMWTCANVVRPSSDTNARSPVDAYEAMRACGSADCTFASAASSSRVTPGASTVVPSGSRTTGTIGAMSPPFP